MHCYTLYPCWLQKTFEEMKHLKIQISFEITDQICLNLILICIFRCFISLNVFCNQHG